MKVGMSMTLRFLLLLCFFGFTVAGVSSSVLASPMATPATTPAPAAATSPSVLRGVQVAPCSKPLPPGQQLNLDFGQLCRYEEANAKLSKPTSQRVVYFGDSITELWGRQIPGLQPDDVINRGISGQTTAQMLVRFRSDVTNLHPHIVHLLMGTNDIAGNTGATTIVRIEEAISSMVEQAQASGIRVVLAAILPAKRYSWRTEIDPVANIRKINLWMADYASRRNVTFVDYRRTVTDGGDGLNPLFTTDGVHPNSGGYNAMGVLAADAIRRANQ